MSMYQNIIERLQTKLDLPQRVIAGDDTKILRYYPETKHQSSQ